MPKKCKYVWAWVCNAQTGEQRKVASARRIANLKIQVSMRFSWNPFFDKCSFCSELVWMITRQSHADRMIFDCKYVFDVSMRIFLYDCSQSEWKYMDVTFINTLYLLLRWPKY